MNRVLNGVSITLEWNDLFVLPALLCLLIAASSFHTATNTEYNEVSKRTSVAVATVVAVSLILGAVALFKLAGQ